MKHLIPLTTILILPAHAQMAPAYQKALDEAVKEYPPGDYKKASQSPAIIAETVDINKPVSPLKQRLATIIIPKLDFKNTPTLEALRIFADECIKNDPTGQGIPIAFAADISQPKKSPVTASLKDMSAQGMLDYLALLVPFEYEILDQHILIRNDSEATQIKAKPVPSNP